MGSRKSTPEKATAMEERRDFPSIESARNAAVAWLENQGVVFGPHRKIAIGRIGILEGHEVGVEATEVPYWRLRLDFDPAKGAHFNAEFGTRAARRKVAFCFPGDEALIARLALSRRPRQ
ncbi:MAG TPA: hypothetical protein VM452_17785 [Caulifigura sp.]|jgi:hypothetical protein|nr:hypothetical protein [Caulifigura sp.]